MVRASALRNKVFIGGSDGFAHALAFVTAEIVHHHQIARFEGRNENLIDVGAEDDAIDRPVDDAGRGEPVAAQRRQEGAERRFGDQTLAFGAPPVRARHVRLRPSLVDEDQPGRIDGRLTRLPLPTPAGDVRPILFGCVKAFF